jgi:hypothetical protein
MLGVTSRPYKQIGSPRPPRQKEAGEHVVAGTRLSQEQEARPIPQKDWFTRLPHPVFGALVPVKRLAHLDNPGSDRFGRSAEATVAGSDGRPECAPGKNIRRSPHSCNDHTRRTTLQYGGKGDRGCIAGGREGQVCTCTRIKGPAWARSNAHGHTNNCGGALVCYGDLQQADSTGSRSIRGSRLSALISAIDDQADSRGSYTYVGCAARRDGAVE